MGSMGIPGNQLRGWGNPPGQPWEYLRIHRNTWGSIGIPGGIYRNTWESTSRAGKPLAILFREGKNSIRQSLFGEHNVLFYIFPVNSITHE